ncbi:hypothetical protein [Janthinobacterium sp. B9-8]|uniref:hypothetical protein n=1 Tax=Janthinobacterium sp. B9-8 TaxID=1236179 RepID=UPI0018D26955|nr:hypothetical protein [Janthinobacterium sp. B9-8]
MAKATAKDLDIAQELILFLNRADEGLLPPKSEGEESEEFDTESYDDLERFHKLTMEFLRIPSALERVVWGMQCILDSGLLDPDSNVLDVHPEIMANQTAAEERGELLAALKDIHYALNFSPSCQKGATHIQRCCCAKCANETAEAAIAKAQKSNQAPEAAKDKS